MINIIFPNTKVYKESAEYILERFIDYNYHYLYNTKLKIFNINNFTYDIRELINSINQFESYIINIILPEMKYYINENSINDVIEFINQYKKIKEKDNKEITINIYTQSYFIIKLFDFILEMNDEHKKFIQLIEIKDISYNNIDFVSDITFYSEKFENIFIHQFRYIYNLDLELQKKKNNTKS